MYRFHGSVVLVVMALLVDTQSTWGQLGITSISPSIHRLAVPVTAPIRIDFDRPIDPASVTAQSLTAFGRWSGPAAGTVNYANGNRTVIFSPNEPFSAGEPVTVTLSNQLRAADMTSFYPGGYSSQFWTASQRVSSLAYDHIGTLVTNSPSRPYGGVATDLDNDGWLDVTLVNEDTADLRVFMNLGTGAGTFAPYTQPTYAVGNRASPSEVADFNGDGNADITVANIDDNTISVLLGNGDGSFRPQQTINVGLMPRGIAVLDFDGDGDPDIVNTNRSSNNLSLHVNNGAGVFGAPTTLNAPLAGEWGLMAGDMNNDGLQDLVVSSGSSSQIQVLTGNGNGTFTPQAIQNAGGRSWMLALGDLNGDGFLDVTSANAQNNNGSVLFGNGDGTLGAPNIYNLAAMGTGSNEFPLATDVGDLDGDGDLDWLTSSFQGEFLVLLNNGTGQFQFHLELNAPTAASCGLMFDMDNDGDMDLGLVDELANVMTLQRNQGSHVALGDFNADGTLGLTDIDALVSNIAGMSGNLIFDVTGDGLVDVTDLSRWLALAGAAHLPSGMPYLEGDANLDGTVNVGDFDAWYANRFTLHAAWSRGDFNADGVVDGTDFGTWNRNNGQSANAAAQVPEPIHWAATFVSWLLGMRVVTTHSRFGRNHRNSPPHTGMWKVTQGQGRIRVGKSEI
jgi:hypothetical protein